MTHHPCGCVTDRDPHSGITRAYEKCVGHAAELAKQPTGEAYYRSIGVLNARGEVREEHYTAELVDALGALPSAGDKWDALEVGCGVSPYVRAVTAAGYCYTGIEPDWWAAKETAVRFGVSVHCDRFTPHSYGPGTFGLILAAHVIEHLPDAPACVRGMAEMLVPGGRLVIVVPDDTDLVNPDHLWFFTTESLYATLGQVGLVVEKMAVRKLIERENFIYCVARKPEERSWPEQS